MADFDHEIISRGNCMICGKPIDIDNIFLCSDCVKKESNATKEQREQLDLMRARAQMNVKSR